MVATTILPSVVQDIGGLDLYAWNTTLFVVASILGSALSARLLGGYGARSAYLVASLFFIAGAALCALAPSMPVMLAGRTVQGFGGGLIFALSYAMINLVFEQRLWPRAMALISAMWGIATLVGRRWAAFSLNCTPGVGPSAFCCRSWRCMPRLPS